MIIRQILRLIIYYLMPLIFISIFYSIIAKTLFQTKDIIHSPNSSSRPFTNEEPRSTNENNIRNNREIFSDHQTTNQDRKARKQLQTRHKLAKIVLFLCLVFFICWLPKQIHDLYWYTQFYHLEIHIVFVYFRFIGVLVYSSHWNHFWQINKTLALVLTYAYACINPIALYFLSSTFRHFYKRYLCFWTNTTCCSKRYLTARRRTQDSATPNDHQHSSSGDNTTTTIYFELNRIKTPNYFRQQSP
jgi:hypothetical protein